MKNHLKFLCTILALLFVSIFVLAGLMYAVITRTGAAKEYDMESQIAEYGVVIEKSDTPVTQTDLEKKFSSMYEISEDGKRISVISGEYLDQYWESNYESEEIHSLNSDEIYYIIQDSIRIYTIYDEIVLEAFGTIPEQAEVANRLPCLEGCVIETNRTQEDRCYDEDVENIHRIILYRLQALSSPDAFFTGAEAIRSVGYDPDRYSSHYPESIFYIPDYSDKTNREEILNVMGVSSDVGDRSLCPDLLVLSSLGEPVIEIVAGENSGVSSVFPTAEMEKSQSVYGGVTEISGTEQDDKTSDMQSLRLTNHFRML